MASSSSSSVEVKKSQEDARLYRGMILDNGLKVLLVSDPTTDKAAAALDVHIGHMSDPWKLPGLAHFLEHMLFLGTEKYPDENEYNKYLSQHGGSSNAYTACDHTNFFFDVAPKHLPGTIDRFAQFFLKPTFTESATDREVKAVNSENDKNLASDAWRQQQLERSLSHPDHDYAKFGTGNSDTLDKLPKANGDDVRKELLAFHEKWYSSNIMAFAVLGNQSLDELQTMVVNLFEGVVNKDVTVPTWPEHPYRVSETGGSITYTTPVKDLRQLNITFPIPDLREHYKSRPVHYLSHLMGHEGKGSVLSELKALGYANNLVGGLKSGSNGFDFFVVNLDLTEEGIEHIEDITQLVFTYLDM
jgi:insulysin